MTRRSTLFTLLSVVLMCTLLLTACGGGGGGGGGAATETSVAGVYELDKAAIRKAAEEELKKQQAEAGGEENPLGDRGVSMMMGMIDEMNMTLTLNADKTAKMDMSMMGDTTVATGTWSLSGSTITITLAEEGRPPEPATGTVSGNTITLNPPEDEEMPFDMVFKKK